MKFAGMTVYSLWVRDPAAAPLTERAARALLQALWRPWLRSWLVTFWAWLRAGL